MTNEDLQSPQLLLTEGDTSQLQMVEQLDLNDPFKMLGIHKTISGNQSIQIKEMKKNSDAYARGILSVNITHFEAWTDLFVIWFGQINYPLAATLLSESVCRKIQSKVIKVPVGRSL
jgi:hypothetical protein